MAGTGNTATLVVTGSTGWTPAITSITPGPATRAALEDTTLATTAGKNTFVPDDLVNWGDFTIEGYYDQSATVITAPIAAAPNTWTITEPLKTGENTAANVAGTAFCTEFTWGQKKNGELQMFSAVAKWDGKTGPAFTAGST